MTSQVFLICPADCSGRRAQLLRTEASTAPVAARLRTTEGVSVGDLFTFISTLYFRGKLNYAKAFARPPVGGRGVFVIVPGQGMVSPETRITLDDLIDMADVEVAPENARYRNPLVRDVSRLHGTLTSLDRVILLGSVATDKYVAPLLDVLGERLWLPTAFVGRGGMSRGGLLLRAAQAQCELEYVAAAGAVRRGRRPPRLGPGFAR